MPIVALIGSEGDATPLLDGLTHDRASGDGLGVWLGRAGADTEAHHDGEIRVVREGRQGPGAKLIGESYRRRGLDCVRDLEGRFAFVLHDARARLLIAGSDLLSLSPLAYWSDRDGLVISSSVLRILRHPRVSATLDELYLAHLVTGIWSAPAGWTALREVRRLPAGAALVAKNGVAQVVDVDCLAPNGPPTRSRAAWIDAFQRELDGAIERSQGEARACVSLSGGLDSAVLASSMARRGDDGVPIAAFSIVGSSRERDESAAISQLVKAYSGRIATTRIDGSDAVDLSVFDAFALPDDPAMTPLAYLPARLRLWRAAQRVGVSLVLDGEGADELFDMMCGLRDALLQRQWRTALDFLWDHRARRALFIRHVILPACPAWVRSAWARRHARRGERFPSFLTGRARAHPLFEQALTDFHQSLIGEDRRSNLTDWLSNPAVVGPAMTHRHLAAQHGLGLASPFLDRRVVELALGIPAEWMLASDPKSFLRAASTGRVPDPIRTRSKDIRFPMLLLRAMITSPAVRSRLRERSVRDRLAEWIRFDRLEGIVDRIADGFDPPDPLVWQQLEGLVSFAYWYPRASREHGVT